MASTISAPLEPNVVRGAQQARIFWAPEYASSSGAEVIDLAKMAGLLLDEWQQTHLTAALGETTAGLWAALEVGLAVPRQNGKNGELEARQLGGLYLLEEPLQIHSAHMADTSLEQFLRLEDLIEGTPEFSRRTKKITRGKGSEEILLHRHPRTGVAPRLRFRPRTGSGGRGFSCGCLYCDEAMILPEAFHGTLMPILSAQPNPQIWYTGSAGDEVDPAHDAVVFARLRERAIAGGDPALVFAEHSVDADRPEDVTPEMATNPALWAEANPALGIRITPGYVAKEQRSMSARAFAVERLGVGAWPRTDGLDGVVIAPEKWAARTDLDSTATGPLCFEIDVTPDRSRSAIGVAGRRDDDRTHVEIVEHKRGTGWVADRIVELVERHKPTAAILDASGPVAALLPELTQALRDADLLASLKDGEITVVNAKEHAQACGMFFDAVDQDQLRHIGQRELTDAVRGGVKRPLGDAWAWSRKNSSVDISPLVAVTLAYWGVQTLVSQGEPQVWDLSKF
jgi:hypothetical protein